MNAPSTTSLHYRAFTAADIPTAHALSQAVNWPHRADDWQFAAAHCTGFAAEENGVMIGTGLCWKFGTDRASLGLATYRPTSGAGDRPQAGGTAARRARPARHFPARDACWQAALRKLGLAVCDTLDQHQGNVGEVSPVTLPDGERLRAATAGDVPTLIDLATRAYGLERKAMYLALLEMGENAGTDATARLSGFRCCVASVGVSRSVRSSRCVRRTIAPHGADRPLAKRSRRASLFVSTPLGLNAE